MQFVDLYCYELFYPYQESHDLNIVEVLRKNNRAQLRSLEVYQVIDLINK
jgi:hypothetical protein